MKYLIVNGDDFGASDGIVRGTLEAHERGVLTSASLMVDAPASGSAARLARARPRLGVGLHFELPRGWAEAPPDAASLRAELRRQLERFAALLDSLPTHLDVHHNLQRRAALLPYFQEIAGRHALPLREHSAVRYFPSFYGRWDGERHLEQLSVVRLLEMVEALPDGVTELACHPGHHDPGLVSDYGIERETELATLCDPALRAGFARLGIRLVDHRDAVALVGSAA